MSTSDPLATPARQFFAALHEGAPARAREILAVYPALARFGVAWAAATADPDALLEFLRDDPDAVTRPIEPGAWTLLHAAAQSPVPDEGAVRRVIQILLDRGADPSSMGGPEGSRVSALFTALHAGHLGAARLLLERGANPNDGECV